MEQSAELPIYVQIISGTILGVALGNLLTGAVRFIQQPRKYQFHPIHGLWIAFILLSVFIFWWQEALAYSKVTWTFELYLFQIAYCSTYLLMTAMLLPESVEDYGTHYDYFVARRGWFYGSIILALVLDVGNVTVKMGWNEVVGDPVYMVINAVAGAVLLVGMAIRSKWVHVSIASAFLAIAVLTVVS